MSHSHMYSYTSIRATIPESITDEEAYIALADSIDTQELVLGRSVEWTGTIGEARHRRGLDRIYKGHRYNRQWRRWVAVHSERYYDL